MQLIKIQLGRAVWVFDTQELNPRGAALFPDLYNGFQQKYQFVTMPKPEDIHAGGSVYFKQGRFAHDAATIVVDLELHPDGFVANTRHSTEAAESFLVDLMHWCGNQFGVTYPPNIIKKRVHRSELVVSMNPALNTLAEKVNQFSEIVSVATAKPSQVIGIQFGSQEIPAAFTIERKADKTQLEDNEYFANAWIQTSLHLDLLSKFEAVMTQ